MKQRIDSWCRNPGCLDTRMPRKLYILVPKSCFCPALLESKDNSIKHAGHLQEVQITSAGSVDRVYKSSVWTLKKNQVGV